MNSSIRVDPDGWWWKLKSAYGQAGLVSIVTCTGNMQRSIAAAVWASWPAAPGN